MSKFRFKEGDRVRIRTSKTASNNMKKHAGEIVTIKSCCSYAYAYELVELEGLWQDRCFEEVRA